MLRATGRFRMVAVARLADGPEPRDMLNRIESPVVRIIPFFMSNGYYSRSLVPRLLDLERATTWRRRGAGGAQLVRYLAPVGTAPEISDLLRRRLLHLCAEHVLVPGAVRVVLAAHGSSRGNGATEAEQHAARLAGAFADIGTAFLTQPPRLGEVLRRRGPRATLVLGLFATMGRHMRVDVPAAIAAARDDGGGPLLWSGAIGEDPAIVEIVLAQLRRDQAVATAQISA